MNLFKKIAIGTAIFSLPLLANAQPNSQDLKNIDKWKKEGKISSHLELRNLGHHYFMKRNGNSITDKKYQKLKELNALEKGNFNIENNGRKIFMEGNLSSLFSKKVLKDLDSIDRDYFISEKEILKSYDEALKNSFLEYASEKLPDSEIKINKEGYAFSEDSKGKLDFLTEVYEEKFGRRKDEFYNLISKKDKVITPNEIDAASKAIYQVIFGED